MGTRTLLLVLAVIALILGFIPQLDRRFRIVCVIVAAAAAIIWLISHVGLD